MRMVFTLRMHGVTVGHCDLERHDATRGVATGVFRPGLGYELVEPIFQLDGDKQRLALDKLALEIVDPQGRVLPTSRIHIHQRRTLELEVHFA
jgi:hypothetical protein